MVNILLCSEWSLGNNFPVIYPFGCILPLDRAIEILNTAVNAEYN